MNNLEDLRNKYVAVSKPDNLEWKNLEVRLGEQNKPTHLMYNKPLAVVLTVLIALTGFASFVQAAGPGDKLYSVKVFKDNLVAEVTRDQVSVVKKRGEDIISVSHDPKKLDDAISEYQQAVEKSGQENNNPAYKQELKQVTKEQEQKFAEEAKENPASKEKLDEVIKQIKKDNGEVKGVKTTNKNQEKIKINHSNKKKN